ncbi:MAG: hypothetical protein FJZ97_14020 [Chloroflexi bacterium]|nr:hypothetical protein [Chloroflexota bacterium]
MRRRVKLIFNPHAHRGRAWEEARALQAIVGRFGESEWATTEHPIHAAQLAVEATGRGFDVVAAIGSDGTASGVINGLMSLPPERRPLLASVWEGSGNDFASNLGIAKEPAAAMQRVFTGSPRAIDVGQAVDQAGRARYCANVLGIGVDAQVTLYSSQAKILQRFAMCLWCTIQAILRTHEAPILTLRTDGGEPIRQSALMFTICNGPRESGGFFVPPDARPDDGILYNASIELTSRLMMSRLIPEVMNGTHGRFRQVHMGQFKELDLASDRPLTIQVDGEVLAGFHSDVTGLRVRVLPAALQVIV